MKIIYKTGTVHITEKAHKMFHSEDEWSKLRDER